MNTSFQRTDASDEWYTPPHIIAALGTFDLDPCAAHGWHTATRHLYEVGSVSGVKKDYYEPVHLSVFWEWLKDLTKDEYKIYPKDSLLDYFNEDRSSLDGYFVESTYNIFA